MACHEDKSFDWVQDFLTPHPGLGQGAEGYAGSLRCAGCHEDKYFSWRETLHARIVQDPALDPAAVVGDFAVPDPARTFTLADVSYTVGGKWRQLYLTQTVTNTFHILPAQWNVETEEWVPYHPEDWQASDWRQECAGCHVTGLNSEAMTFTEFGVGCESCHGPGEAHAVDPENVKPFAEVDAQVCGACHSRGEAPDGHPFPTTYRPGDTLADHFTFTTDPEAVWPDGSARLNHQQYMDWQLGSTMSQAEGMSCTTCHAVHDAGAASGQLQEPLDDLCVACHADQKALVKHTPFHEVAMTQNEFFCNDCHMPETATSAVLNDIHNHSLLQPDPQGTIDHGGVAAMPNACNNCHTESGETAEWAAQTIAYAQQQAPPVTGGFFGPGPTPTSPPPPTPLAVVGEPAVMESHVETGQWVRYGLFISFGVIALLAVAWVAFRIRTRGERNV
jgi:predicted CXXCH cytochrome family protein